MKIDDLTYESWYSWIEREFGEGGGNGYQEHISQITENYNNGRYSVYQDGDLDIIGLGSRAVWVHPSGEAYTSGQVSMHKYHYAGDSHRYKMLTVQ